MVLRMVVAVGAVVSVTKSMSMSVASWGVDVVVVRVAMLDNFCCSRNCQNRIRMERRRYVYLTW
jgi:hypothetical protein